jgi:hypothetical protein
LSIKEALPVVYDADPARSSLEEQIPWGTTEESFHFTKHQSYYILISYYTPVSVFWKGFFHLSRVSSEKALPAFRCFSMNRGDRRPVGRFVFTQPEVNVDRDAGERFRLIYLKSTGSEKSGSDVPSPSRDPNETARGVPFSDRPEETSSAKAFLQQAQADLSHPDPRVRSLSVQYLERQSPATAIPLLQEVLSDKDPEVRAQGLRSLIRFQDPGILPLLKRYLKDGHPGVRIAALRGMFKYRGGVDLNILLQLLSDESPLVRRKVATLVGWTQMEGVLPILVQMARDQDARVRKAAIFSLVTLYPEEGEARLLEAMASDPDLRSWAKKALEKRIAKPFGKKAPISKRV